MQIKTIGNRKTLAEPASTGGSTLSVAKVRTYLANSADQQNRIQSVDYNMTNSGLTPANSVTVTNSDVAGGVTLSTPCP